MTSVPKAVQVFRDACFVSTPLYIGYFLFSEFFPLVSTEGQKPLVDGFHLAEQLFGFGLFGELQSIAELIKPRETCLEIGLPKIIHYPRVNFV